MWKDTCHGDLIGRTLEAHGEGNLRVWVVVFEYPKFSIRYDGTKTARVNTIHAPEAYKAIRLWGENLRSFEYYIKGEQAKAAHDGAPVDAIYFSDTLGRWMHVGDLAPNHPFHTQYAKYLEKTK